MGRHSGRCDELRPSQSTTMESTHSERPLSLPSILEHAACIRGLNNSKETCNSPMRSFMRNIKARTNMHDHKRRQSPLSKYSYLFLLQTLLHLHAPLAMQHTRVPKLEEPLLQFPCPAETCTTPSIALQVYTPQHVLTRKHVI